MPHFTSKLIHITLPVQIAVILWLCLPTASSEEIAESKATKVLPVPKELRKNFGLAPFYEKWVDVGGLPVVSSGKVNSHALLEAAWLIDKMIGHRPEVLRAMAKNRVRFSIMAHNELTTNVPEHSDLTPKDYWDRRARGLGATIARPSVSCGEENLLKFPGDPYRTENILIHEFAHAIHRMGMSTIDPTFDKRLEAVYKHALENELWKDTYAAKNHREYWAEGVQSWFNANRSNDALHNRIDTRPKLKEYDVQLAKMIEEVFGDKPWKYSPPSVRKELPHLRNYNPKTASTFKWPDHLKKLKLKKKNADTPK